MVGIETGMNDGEGPPSLDQTTAWHLDRIEGDVIDQGERLARLEADLRSSVLASGIVIRTILTRLGDPIDEAAAREAALVALREALGPNAAAAIVEAIVVTPSTPQPVN